MAFQMDDVLDAIRQAGVTDTKQLNLVVEQLKAIEEEKKEEREANKEPKQKNQFVVFVMDDGSLQGKDLIGYVLQIPEGDSISTTPDRFIDAVRAYNNGARKAKKYPVTTIGDGMRAVKGKWLKDSKIKVKTKESIAVIPLSNTINNPKGQSNQQQG